MNKKSSHLYNNLRPNLTLKGTGFKNKKSALKTIDLVKKRSIRYQYDVINTMYNRAKFHPHKTKEMEEAMKVFSVWIKKYPTMRKKEDKTYPFLPYTKILEYEPLAAEYGVSEVARGIKKGTKTDEGFLKKLKDVKGKAYKLQYIPVKKNRPEGQDYWSYRITFLNSRTGQIKKGKTPLFYIEGKYKGKPTKQHIICIMHGYSPVPNKI